MIVESLNTLTIWQITLLIALLVWEAIWKGIALWRSGRNNQPTWFLCIFILNSVGILPIIYLKFFQRKQMPLR